MSISPFQCSPERSSAQQLDLLPRRQCDISLLPVRAASSDPAKAFRLSFHVDNLYRRDLHLKMRFYGFFDLRFCRITADLKDVLVPYALNDAALLGHVGAQ